MTTSASPKPFSLAIIGGGIAGCVLSISLTKHRIPHTLYESASQFGEIGAGVGFEPNYVRTMGLISPELRQAFLNCAEWTDEEHPKYFAVRVGDKRRADKNGVVCKSNGKDIRLDEGVFEWPSRPGPRGGVHRAHLLDEFVKLIPNHVPKFKKRLVDVKEAHDGSGDAVLHFADGSTAQHTAVLGCDGIKSRTRELVLGKEEGKPVFSGKYAYRGLIPMEKAKEFMVGQNPNKPNMYLGYHGHVLTFPIVKGTILNGILCSLHDFVPWLTGTVVAFSSRESWTDPEWVIPNSKESMIADYSEWSSTVQSIISAMQKHDVWALFNHLPARTYFSTKPRICLVGDAAHASTPHQGSGAGMCVEDVYILGELLGMIAGAQDLGKVFRAFDSVRRPRSLNLVKTSREAAMVYEFEGFEGDDLKAVERNCVNRMGWIWDHDISGDLEKARLMLSTNA
jgi:salicylate hydroxylase